MIWLWIAFVTMGGLVLAAGLGLVSFYVYLVRRFGDNFARVFKEKPLFIIPKGQPIPGSEDVRFRTADGLTLAGCYLRGSPPRRGVIMFGPEFGSNRWSCFPYCESLLANGFDIFSFETRGQGDSDPQPGFEPMQWITSYEIIDFQAALAYLKSRGDADPKGIGFFGISKGGGVGLLTAARDSSIRCCVTDGSFGTYTTMLPYMRKWIAIYSTNYFVQRVVPDWLYGQVGLTILRRIGRERGCWFPHLENAIGKLAPRPLLMIHGGGDTYIKPSMAEALFDKAKTPKEFWVVEGAKHNQALQVAGEEYRRRLLTFFQTHLAEPTSPRPDLALIKHL